MNPTPLTDPVKLQEQVVGGLETILWILRETRVHQIIECRRNRLLSLAHRRRFVLEDRANQVRSTLTVEGSAAREHLEQHGPEREDVGSGAGFLPFDLFGRHVLERPEHRTLFGQWPAAVAWGRRDGRERALARRCREVGRSGLR
jgi:hypothetical protein